MEFILINGIFWRLLEYSSIFDYQSIVFDVKIKVILKKRFAHNYSLTFGFVLCLLYSMFEVKKYLGRKCRHKIIESSHKIMKIIPRTTLIAFNTNWLLI